MSGGAQALDAMIARLRKLPEIAAQAATEAAPLVEKALRATAASGADPFGKAWAPKKDGTRALQDAASAITASAKGPVVQVKVTGGYAIQNRLHGDYRRQLLPDAGKLPETVTDALQKGAKLAFDKAMR